MTGVLDADVLIIGGGAAGASAALKAHEAGARVVMVVKGLLGKSGCSIFASHLPYYDVSTPERRAARFEYAVRYYNHYLVDQEYVQRMGQFVRTHFFDDLEKAGVYWRRTDDGRVLASSNLVPVAVAHKQGASGVIIMDTLRRLILSRDIRVLEETMATALLVSGGCCLGAVALDCRTGEIQAICSKSTILATGQSDYLSLRSTGTREQSADGISLALRAGCEVMNMEIQWYHATDVAEPTSWMRFHIYPNPLVGTAETSRMYNSRGEVFFEQKVHAPGSSAPYVEQIRRLAQQVERGLARWDGGYYSGYTHIDPEVIRTYQHQAKIWDKLGLDVGKDLLECGITLHMRQGGVFADTKTLQTGVEGLYVAGAIGGHYLGGVGPVTYDGSVAGEEAARRAGSMSLPPLPDGQIRSEVDRLEALLAPRPEDGYYPVQLKTMIRQVMWEKMGYVKDEASMTAALGAFRQLRETMAPRMGLRSTSRRWNTGWIDAIDVYAMLDACEATARSGLYRKESRGPFYRRDYPYVDNDNWLVKIIQRWDPARGAGPADDDGVRFRTEPYATPVLKPPAGKQPFFEADY